MADFTTPFANGQEERRLPTADEKALGFPCGPADRFLFDGLFHRIESELGDLISFAGLTGEDGDNTQVRQAVLALIANAIGEEEGGDTSAFLQVIQARARLPIMPEVQTTDGKLTITAPSTGTVRIAAGTTFLHRGIYPETTAQTDFVTSQSKVYHLRWIYQTGYVLKDLTDVSYNPGSIDEADKTFDSSYDNMLIARIVTNASNVATITALVNKSTLEKRMVLQGQNMRAAQIGREKLFDFSGDIGWARTPRLASFNWSRKFSVATTTDGDSDHYLVGYGGAWNDPKLTQFPFTRYDTKFSMVHDDYDTTLDIVYDTMFIG